MAIEIIPKRKVKKVFWANIILYLLLIIFLGFFVSYFILNKSQQKLAQELSELEKNLTRTPAEKALEEELTGYQEKIGDIGPLISSHQFPVNIFDFFEKVSHPKVWFNRFDLISEQEVVNLSGQTDSFETLAQQILIFEKEEIIRDINLPKVSISKEGKISFDLRLTFDPEIFK
jgi:amino acid permease